MQRLSDLLSLFWAAKGNAAIELRIAALWAAWGELFGPDLGDMAAPLGRRQRTLVLGVEEPMVMQELSMFSQELLDRVNGFLGEKYFDKISLELISGRARLDATEPPLRSRPVLPDRPAGLGQAAIPGDSPVARCYAKYVRLFGAPDTARQPRGTGRSR
jgi:hypothetical protein